MAGSMVTFVPGANVIGMSTTMLAMLAKAKSSERYLLVLDTETSLLYLMDRNFILSLVSSHPSIEYEYTLETEQNNEVTLLKYLQMVNAATGN